MKRYRNREVWDFEMETPVSRDSADVILGLDGGAAATVCVCISAALPSFAGCIPNPFPVLARAVAGFSNHNSVGESAAKETIEKVMAEALLKAGSNRSAVRAVCLALAGVNHPSDQERILDWLRWTYADPSWTRIAKLSPAVVSSAEAGDEVANRILHDTVLELTASVKAVVQRLDLCGEGILT
ncbi:hypothetical protein GW17_00008880 [Ensete ventricosum]|uniref:N-acetyl-D-glucosamine kinase n=1 Tax=Ensete ventricosum TaxID=4639 RepID=A0A427A1Y6_ENSVE|nr:hypothetical protein B296_00012099 [Ensete ventricosum]RWW26724.1 hypothetical protein GW17_00008880 [Ensete ventricosum]